MCKISFKFIEQKKFKTFSNFKLIHNVSEDDWVSLWHVKSGKIIFRKFINLITQICKDLVSNSLFSMLL